MMPLPLLPVRLIPARFLRPGLPAVLWLLVTLTAVLHVGVSARHGLPLQTDLMALLPDEDQNPAVQAAKARMVGDLSRRVVLLVGHPDATTARAAADRLRQHLFSAGVLAPAQDVPSVDALKAIARAYAPHQAGLLAEADRDRLSRGDGQVLLNRVLSQVYGVGGFAGGQLLATDPFLLLPAFLADLPVPVSRLTLTDGWPTVTDAGMTWVVLSGVLTGEAYALTTQQQMAAALTDADADLATLTPPVQRLRLGAVFYAGAGAHQALTESSWISTLSLLGITVLILSVFRSARPLFLTALSLGCGLVVALSASLLLFGTLHVITLIFGAGLIGVSVDYSLHVFGKLFSDVPLVRDRLQKVRPGLLLGLLTTLLGYAALALSPLPGLQQVAVFSATGLIAAFLSVLLWFPVLDRSIPRPLPVLLQVIVDPLWQLWSPHGYARLRLAILLGLGGAALWGATHLTTDDDVRRQQSLDPILQQEQAEILRLTGLSNGSQFFLVTAESEEQALQQEEHLAERLKALQAAGALSGWRSPARFVPSHARQQANQALIDDQLRRPHLLALRQAIGLPETPSTPATILRLEDLRATQALPVLDLLISASGHHIVLLDNPRDLAALQAAAEGLDGVRFIDPTGDVSRLLGVYRHRTLILLGLSALLMSPLLIWRYGLRGAAITAFPPVCAVVLTPLLLAVAGVPVSFFSAMALILLLSVGIDYAVFCAEADGRKDSAALAATLLAALTTFLSFGLLAFSGVAAVRAFGLTMSTGLLLAVLLAPVAGRARPRHIQPSRKNPR